MPTHFNEAIGKAETTQADIGQKHDRYHDAQLTRSSLRKKFAFCITLACALLYAGWVARSINYAYWYISGPYIFAEALCLGSLILWGLMLMDRREHSPIGLELIAPTPAVDVLVTTCGEDISVIEHTLRACAAIEYVQFHVTVADDRANPEVAKLCRAFGFTHLCRSTHENRKAGNLNYALSRTIHPFLLILDADQVPHPKILQLLMGYLTHPKVAFVQSFQAFSTAAGDPWEHRDRMFYGAMQPGRNASNSAIACGSGVVFRRTALEQIGGFSAWNIVEDLYTSLLLHAAGWRSVYHPFPLSHGVTPTEVGSHIRQRWQWAVDSLRLLFWRCPLFTRGLSWRQRANYFAFGYHYLVFGVAYPIFFLLPAWGLYSGKFLMNAPIWDFFIWRTPYFLSFVVLNRMICEGRYSSKTFRSQIFLFWAFFSAIVTALLSRRTIPTYTVTGIPTEHSSLIGRIHYVLPHALIMGLCTGGIVYGHFHRQEHPEVYWINVFWAISAIWILLPFVLLALRGALSPKTNNIH